MCVCVRAATNEKPSLQDMYAVYRVGQKGAKGAQKSLEKENQRILFVHPFKRGEEVRRIRESENRISFSVFST